MLYVLGPFRKWSRKHGEFPHNACPIAGTAPPPIDNNPHQSGTFIIIDGPTLTRHYYSVSIVYMKIHTWCFTF